MFKDVKASLTIYLRNNLSLQETTNVKQSENGCFINLCTKEWVKNDFFESSWSPRFTQQQGLGAYKSLVKK